MAVNTPEDYKFVVSFFNEAPRGGYVAPFDVVSGPNGERMQVFGMTLRAHFAGLAMQARLANAAVNGDAEAHAKAAVKYADALIAELNK